MVRNSYVETEAENMNGGKGKIFLKSWMADSELPGNVSFIATAEIAVGAFSGNHGHEGDAEIYHIVSGVGEYDDNGKTVTVKPGDVTVCYDGESHAIKNIGDEPLVMTTIIIKS